MKTKDRIKEEIGLLKLFFGIISAANFSLIAWAWNQAFGFEVKNTSVYLAIFVALAFLGAIYKSLARKIKKLDDL